MKLQAALTVTRDILSMVLGTFIAVNEELTGHIHAELLLLATALLGLPSGVAVVQLARGKPTIPGTQSESSVSQPSSPHS